MTRQLPLLGMVMMIAGASFLASKDGIAKMLIADYHPLILMWSQYAASWIIIAPIVAYKYGVRSLWPKPFGLQLFRGLAATLTVLLFFTALQFIQLAEAHAMVFIGPLLATILSSVVLGERVGIHRISAVILGFGGVLMILRPDFSAASPGHFIAMGAGLAIACYFLSNRKAAPLAPPLASVSYSVIVGAVVLLPALPFFWTMPAVSDFSLFGLFFIISVIGQILAVLAFNFGPASIVAPFHYSQIITSVLFGYLAFNQLPDLYTFAGIGIVISCGIYIAVRERHLLKGDA